MTKKEKAEAEKTAQQELEKLLESLAFESEQLKELFEILRGAAPRIMSRFAQIERIRKQLDEKEQALKVALLNEQAEILTQINECEKAVERKKEQIKNYCHNLPEDVVKGGFGLEHEGLRVSVSRAEFVTTYKARELLDAHPELEDVYSDGDPLCEVTIVPSILERLMRSGKIEIEDIDKYKIVTKKRNPSVSIKPTKDTA